MEEKKIDNVDENENTEENEVNEDIVNLKSKIRLDLADMDYLVKMLFDFAD